MAAQPVRASAGWLALREPVDAAARSTELVDELVRFLPAGDLVIHDLGCGTGSMMRWLAPRLPGPQRWMLHDRDAELLHDVDLDGTHVDTRLDDITRIDPAVLAGADLLTASALLDMMTAEELERFVHVCTAVGCPVLLTLSVLGRVELTPADPLDTEVMAAFNAHQRRHTGEARLLGPDAAHVAAIAFEAGGREVVSAPSPWHLGPDEADLAAEWFTGWVAAALEQRPAMAGVLGPYARRRLAAAADGSLSITVHHEDLLVLPASDRVGCGAEARQPVVHGRHASNRGVVVEDALVPDRADDDDVLEVAATGSGEGGPELDVHAAAVVLRHDDEHGVSAEYGVEVIRGEVGRDLRD